MRAPSLAVSMARRSWPPLCSHKRGTVGWPRGSSPSSAGPLLPAAGVGRGRFPNAGDLGGSQDAHGPTRHCTCTCTCTCRCHLPAFPEGHGPRPEVPMPYIVRPLRAPCHSLPVLLGFDRWRISPLCASFAHSLPRLCLSLPAFSLPSSVMALIALSIPS